MYRKKNAIWFVYILTLMNIHYEYTQKKIILEYFKIIARYLYVFIQTPSARHVTDEAYK